MSQQAQQQHQQQQQEGAFIRETPSMELPGTPRVQPSSMRPLQVEDSQPGTHRQCAAAQGASPEIAARMGPEKASPPLLGPFGMQLQSQIAEGCFRLRRVSIAALLSDGTLGLLLHGTTIVGFCCSEAEEAGWAIGDQIVEVNGRRVSLFDEFLDRFGQAQDDGFPIEFSVLRRETALAGDEETNADNALDAFFSGTNFADLAGQMQAKFGGLNCSDANEGDCMNALSNDQYQSIIENPYIQALRRRRGELHRSTKGWRDAEGDSPTMAARLATERSDALATLIEPRGATRTRPAAGADEGLFCNPQRNVAMCFNREVASGGDILYSPRADNHMATAPQATAETVVQTRSLADRGGLTTLNAAKGTGVNAQGESVSGALAPSLEQSPKDANLLPCAPDGEDVRGMEQSSHESERPQSSRAVGSTVAGTPVIETELAPAESRNFALRLLPISR